MDPHEKTDPMFPLLGRKLKHYQIESVIGQGGMGVVYGARDTRLQRPIALKVLPTGLNLSESSRKRFLLEARAAARISHPAVAQIHDVDEEDGTIFIAMELVRGKTVRELIQRKELDLLGAIDIAIQVAEGLKQAHGLGIVHRDIKPANVILTSDGHAKILDFGLAKLMEPSHSTTSLASNWSTVSNVSHTQLGAVKGTPSYMSPEQVKGDTLDARSDLFSLGVMIFEMTTWETPFRRDNIMETMRAVAFDETPSMHSLRPNLPLDLQRIVSRCLRKRPEDRYPDARALAEELRILRRETESGTPQALRYKQWFGEVMDRLGHLKPAQYAWLAGGLFAIALMLFLYASGAELGGFIVFSIVGIYVFRRIRHQPQRLMEQFARKVSRLPEVRIIARQNGKFLIAVDRPSGQLYTRINALLSQYNRKLFFGDPMTVAIRGDLSPEEQRQILSNPGVQFVRDQNETNS
jgi:predicted Ser/Thr protein kinase